MGDKTKDLMLQQGAGAIGSIVNAGLGLALGEIQDRRQRRQEQKLQDMAIKGNKEMLDYSYAKQMQMWKDTNYSAQVAELEKAGLNPALIYGMGGGGGTTTGSGSASVSQGHAPAGGGEAIQMMGMGLQLKMQEAQIKLMESQTNKTNVEASKIGGVDSDKVKMEIEGLIANIADTRAKQALTEVQTDIAELQKSLSESTLNDSIDNIKYNLRLLKNNTSIAEATYEDVLKTVSANAIGAILQNGLIQAQTGNVKQSTAESKTRVQEIHSKIALNKQELINASQKIAMEWRSLNQKDSEIAIQAFKAQMDANYPGLFDVIGSHLDQALENLFKGIKGQERTKHHQMK